MWAPLDIQRRAGSHRPLTLLVGSAVFLAKKSVTALGLTGSLARASASATRTSMAPRAAGGLGCLPGFLFKVTALSELTLIATAGDSRPGPSLHLGARF